MKFISKLNDNSIGDNGTMTNDQKTKELKNKTFLSYQRKLVSRTGFQVKLGMTLLCFLLLVVSSPAFAESITSTDPMYIGVTARPLGMGKAFVAVAEDGDTLFVNPAGLAKAQTPKLTSMYSSVLGDTSYMVIGGIYPQSQNSAIGAGAVMSSITGIDLRDAAGTSLGNGSWGSNVFFLSYGVGVGSEDKLQLGGSVKYYNQGGSGASTIETASGTGIGFDVGALFSPSDNVTLGISAQNPTNTKIQSGNNTENTIPSVIKIGGSYKLKPGENQKLTLAADLDLAKARSSTIHAGAEYQLTPNIALRGGIDQDPGPSGIETNPTAGIGIRSGGMEFNYAYHPYGAIADNTTHYFSVSYVGVPKPVEEASSLSIALAEPADKSVIYSDSVKVSGTVKGASVVLVEGINVPIGKDGSFTATIPVSKVGKKLVQVEAKDAAGKIAKDSRRILKLVNFADVPQGYWAKQPIEGTSTVGLVQGYPDGSFKPDRVLTRAELSTLLVRAKGIEVSGVPSNVFKDVKSTHWASAYIKEAVRQGLVKGYPDKKFRPEKRISKTEAIIVLVRYDALPVSPVSAKPFADVALRHWAVKHIQAAKDAGILSYLEGGQLGVKQDVTRAEAIQMMSKTSLANKLIKDLFSWEKGYEIAPTLKAGL